MLNTDNKNFKILALAISALIVGVEAQVTCSTKSSPPSPQCCWVVRSWQLMGKSIPTGISPNDNSCCTKRMAGVTCDSTKTKVTSLDWSFKNLTGSIPSDIGNLKSLTELKLFNNRLSGSIPAEIGSLTSLTYLDVSSNLLTGTFRINCDSGMVINVQGNQVTLGNCQVPCTTSSPECCWVVRSWKLMGKAIPTGIKSTDNSCCTLPMSGVTCDSTKTKVTKINWSYKSLTGSIPSSIVNLTSLTRLDLYNNQISGSIPSEIGNMASLTYLDLYNNQLNGSIPSSIGNLTSLTRLSLSLNQLSGSIPSSIGKLTSLTDLSFSRNQLSGSIPAEIGNLTKLTGLSLYNNQLSGSIPSSIGNLRSLTWLGFWNNCLNGSIPASIGNLTNLTQLWLYNNQLSGSFPSSIGNLKSLVAVHLGANQLNGSIPSSIGNFINLTHLFLNNNQLSGTVPASFGSLPLLNTLDFSSNTGLVGTFTPKSITILVVSLNTSVIVCTSATGNGLSLPAIFPNASSTESACLASTSTPLVKRALTLSQTIGGFRYFYPCNVDSAKNPYQDCFNSMAGLCKPDNLKADSTLIPICKNAVDQILQEMDSPWLEVRKKCAKFSSARIQASPGVSSNSQNCRQANSDLRATASYTVLDPMGNYIVKVDERFTDSVNSSLWNNPYLLG